MATRESPTVALNNYLQSKGRLSALTWDEKFDGPRHEVVWSINCKIDNIVVATGQGTSKASAKEAAAKEALQILKPTPNDG